MSKFGQVHQDGQTKILAIATKFRCPEDLIEDRLWLSLDKILQANTLEEATDIQTKVLTKMDALCLDLWAKGKIKGPVSNEGLQKEAKRAEGLAKMFDKKDSDETRAEKQRQRAEDLRLQARSISAAVHMPLPAPKGAPLPPSKYPGACRTEEEVQAQIAAGKKIIILDLTTD